MKIMTNLFDRGPNISLNFSLVIIEATYKPCTMEHLSYLRLAGTLSYKLKLIVLMLSYGDYQQKPERLLGRQKEN